MGRRRQVTLIEEEVWERLMRQLEGSSMDEISVGDEVEWDLLAHPPRIA